MVLRMDMITYSLLDEEGRSDGFYEASAWFADAVRAHSERKVLPEAEEFRRYILRTKAEPVRTAEEYGFELLTLGVLLRIYAPAAEGLLPWQGRLLRRLVRLRNGTQRLKPAADRLRAVWGEAWLTGKDRNPLDRGNTVVANPPQPSLARLDRFLLWLEAGGEFKQEAGRFRLWQGYLRQLPTHKARYVLQAALDEAVWFETASEAALGRYTPHVERYQLQHLTSRTHPREDFLLRARRRVEYHLNLVGAELMNRAYLPAYEGCTSKAVILPTCLKARSDEACPASRKGSAFRCLRCTDGCRIAAVADLAERFGFELIVVSHESDAFSQQAAERLAKGRFGIVGVACALNLLAGGWRATALGIPAQCVILDYSGCRSHWDESGFPTDMNMNRLLQLLGVNSPPRNS